MVVLVVGIFAYLALVPATGEKPQAACLLLVDRTGSSINENTRESYENLASHAIEGCETFKSSLSVYYFDNANAKLQQASEEQPFAFYRPPTRRASVGEDQVEKATEAANEAVESVFATDEQASVGGHGSDIVTALSLAAQSLQRDAATLGVTDMYIVVLTDGYQTGPELGMRGTFGSPDVPPDELIDKAEALDLVPTLKGVDVSFVGVGGGVASDEQQVPAWYEAQVHGFWTGLVERGGGQMCMYTVEENRLPGVC